MYAGGKNFPALQLYFSVKIYDVKADYKTLL